jgi:hypothetical protein
MGRETPCLITEVSQVLSMNLWKRHIPLASGGVAVFIMPEQPRELAQEAEI